VGAQSRLHRSDAARVGFNIINVVDDEDGIYICRRGDFPYRDWGNQGAVYPARGK
jgi:hypothetical protein